MGPRGEGQVVQSLLLQAREEGLRDGVVVAVARVAHALRDLPLGEHLTVRLGSVLAAAIGVVDQPGRRAAGRQCALQIPLGTQGPRNRMVAGPFFFRLAIELVRSAT
jgi:hypothetical protein